MTTPLSVTVTGNPSPEELAAVLALVASSGGAVEEPEPEAGSRWSEKSGMLRAPLARDGWR